MEVQQHDLTEIGPLRAFAPDRVLLLGFDVQADAGAQALLRALPGARVVSLDDSAKRPWVALRRVLSVRVDAVVAVQPYAKLQLLAFAVPARAHLVLADGALAPIDPGAAAVKLPAAQRLASQVRAVLDRPRVPGPRGPGNDYSFIADRVPSGPPAAWARLRASVMVPVYNRQAVLEKTLVGLARQTYPRALFEVIIADDGSADHPETLVDAFPDLDLKVVRQEDLGYRLAEVRNLAIGAATGDVVVSLDCDMFPEDDFLASHLKWFHAGDHPIFVVGYRKFVNTDGLSADAIRADPAAVRALPAVLAPAAIRTEQTPTVDWRVAAFEDTRMLRDHPAPYLMASGGNVAFRRSDAVAAGLYHDGYQRWGGEDADFGYQLERRGCYFVAEPGALAYHQDHPSSVVREEDRKVTYGILGRRVPRLRDRANGPYELPLVTVLVLEDGHGDVAATRAALDAQVERDFEHQVVPAGDGAAPLAAAIEAARGEMVLLLLAGDRLAPTAVGAMSGELRRHPRAAFAYPDARAYSRFAHLLGDRRPGPLMFRLRDYRRTRSAPREPGGPPAPDHDVGRAERNEACGGEAGPPVGGGFAACAAAALAELELSLRLAEVGEAIVVLEDEVVVRAPRLADPAGVRAAVEAGLARLELPWRLDEDGAPHSPHVATELLLRARKKIDEYGS